MTYNSLTKGDDRGRNVGTLFEYVQRHDWIPSKFCFAEDEDEYRDAAKHEKTYHFGTAPWEGCASKVKTKKQHEDRCQNCKASKPINGFEAFNQLRFWIVNIQEEEHDEGDSADGWNRVSVRCTREYHGSYVG
jgi:hypothetical protein